MTAVIGHPRLLADHPNVLLIAIDDLNDWIGCLDGHPRAITPNIDALTVRGELCTHTRCQVPYL